MIYTGGATQANIPALDLAQTLATYHTKTTDALTKLFPFLRPPDARCYTVAGLVDQKWMKKIPKGERVFEWERVLINFSNLFEALQWYCTYLTFSLFVLLAGKSKELREAWGRIMMSSQCTVWYLPRGKTSWVHRQWDSPDDAHPWPGTNASPG